MAKTETTVRGYVYTVTSPNGGTVTDAEGKLNKTVAAGDQVTVQAPSDSLTCDDDDAVIFKANFKSPLLALRLLGQGVNALPAGYARLEFLESTGTQHIETGLPINNGSALTVTCEIDPNSGVANGALFGAQNGGVYQERAGWSEFTAGTRAWVFWGWLSAEQTIPSSPSVRHHVSLSQEGLYYDGVKLRDVEQGTFSTSGSCWLFARNRTDVTVEKYHGKVYSFSFSQDGKLQMNFVPALDPNGTPCMFDTVTGEPYRNAGSGQFVAGMTLAQVRALRLPAGGGKLTLALPHEASIDKLAQAALERARANGWELTLQYAEAEVPAGYRKLDFLESFGDSWIDTEFTPKMGDELSFEVSCKNVNETPSTLFSAGNATSQLVGVALYRSEFLPAGFTSLYIRYFSDYSPNFVLPTNTKAKIKINNTGECFLNEKVQFINQPKGEVNTSLLLCKRVAPISTNFFIGRIYSFSIYRAGVAQVNYVPCISPEGKLGMYNKVDGIMKENAGSGAFIAGLATVDDVRSLWLPETSGELRVSIPADTPDSAVEQLRRNNPTWQIAIQYRTDNEN